MTDLSPDQQATVQQWATEGATLNDIQERLKTQFGLNFTYLDLRLLLVDLQVRLKDKPRPAEPIVAATPPAPETAAQEAAPAGQGVSVRVDEIAIPGSLISGKVTFSDGKTASWFIDQMGRPGMRSPEPGYQPPAGDMPKFQNELDRVLMEAGF